MTDTAERTDAIKQSERWLTRRGLPHFIAHYSAVEDVFTRTLPVLAFIAIAQIVLDAPRADYSWWWNAIMIAAAFAAAVGIFAGANLARGRRAFARPNRVGPVELAIFVFVPPLAPVISGGDWEYAIGSAIGNLLLLGVIYLITSYGVVPMVRWALLHGADQLLSAINVLLRALPVLLLVVIVVFLNTEAWQVANELNWSAVVLVTATFIGIAVAFAAIRVPREIARFSQESWSDIRRRVARTPAAVLLSALGVDPPPPPRLTRRERVNVGLVVLVSELILVAIVAVVMFTFLVGFGAAAIHADVVAGWIGQEPDMLWTFHLVGQQMVVSVALLKVSSFLAGFCALSFTVSLLTDAGYQEEFLTELEDEIAEAFAVRAVYRGVVGDAS